jgi:predicted nucleic acid-binding protein
LSDLAKFLGRHKRVAIDTTVFVYFVEASERYGELAKSIFAWVKRPGNSASASTIVVTELMSHLYKEAEAARGGKLSSLHRGSWEEERPEIVIMLARYPNLEWVAADFAVADLAARFRARYGLKTPDALHAATAVQVGATGFVTNDTGFNRVMEFETLQFDALL